MSGTATKLTAAQQNAMARTNIFRMAKPILQQVTTKTIAPVASGDNVLQINPLQIGFLRRFVVVVTATISNTDATHAAALTPNGADNILKNITFNDFTGNPRHNCSGRSLSYVEALKYQRIPGAALASDSVSGFGSIVGSNVAPTIAAASAGTLTRVFEIPIMVDTGHFMAGGMWLGVNNQSTLLTLTINANPIVLPGADPSQAVYQLAAGGTTIAAIPITSATVTVYQDYWNNVPMDQSANPILPISDISTAYMITEASSGMTFAAGSVSSWNFPTFSKLLGTYLQYNNGGVLNPGTDLTGISLVVSNYSIIKQYSPQSLDRLVRDICGASFPAGSYGLPSRMHPLDVSQYPSLQLQVTAATAAAGASMLITTELLRPVQFMSAASGMGGA